MSQYKPCHTSELARDYVEFLIEELESQAARYKPINHRYLAELKAALPTAPAHFVLHKL
mgnify:CR=1 FL=1